MRVHFREKYGKKGEEILYVTPDGMYSTTKMHQMPFFLTASLFMQLSVAAI